MPNNQSWRISGWGAYRGRGASAAVPPVPAAPATIEGSRAAGVAHISWQVYAWFVVKNLAFQRAEEFFWPFLTQVPRVEADVGYVVGAVEAFLALDAGVVVCVSHPAKVFNIDAAFWQVEVGSKQYGSFSIRESEGIFVEKWDAILVQDGGNSSFSFGAITTWCMGLVFFEVITCHAAGSVSSNAQVYKSFGDLG